MILTYFVKGYKLISYPIIFKFSWFMTWLKFKANRVKFSNDFISKGIPLVSVSLSGSFSLGVKFVSHSGDFNIIGRQQKCYFIVRENARLSIGDNVGVSSCAIICHHEIVIENDVRIGGGVVIYDTDFHSLDVTERVQDPEILTAVKVAPVKIEKGAFIGAHSIILKGVTIGEGSIIGAGSVVARSIPANEIWAGNPAKKIKSIGV